MKLIFIKSNFKLVNCRIDLLYPTIFILQTWLNISKDLVVVVDKKVVHFWRIIKEGYDNYRGRFIERQWSTLKSQWHLLNEHDQRFCDSYKLFVANKKSGKSKNGVMDDAHKLFLQLHKQCFTLEHAWKLLKDKPK